MPDEHSTSSLPNTAQPQPAPVASTVNRKANSDSHDDPPSGAPDEHATMPGSLASPVAPDDAHDLPDKIGRYRVRKFLGKGAFGRVYLAHDDDLNRPVAIKTPRPERVAESAQAEAYLAEARVVASLKHPAIVPVYDVGRLDGGPCFVVSEFIAGGSLADRLERGRLTPVEAARFTAAVAEALHHAHARGVFHRDIKPANLLLDAAGAPYVADFGLALREEDFGRGAGGRAGTYAYMSPEQARGESHRVDGRADIFSLGVVFYEMLTGQRPFRGDSANEVIEQICKLETRPPRQIDDAIPRELERICLKALAKRAADRYSTANDMADDLRCFLEQEATREKGWLVAEPQRRPSEIGADSENLETQSGIAGASLRLRHQPRDKAGSDNLPLKIVPKGLRSFDEHDADFFLELLPGPRDRDGLPDSIRFWKTRIEEPDPDKTFAVGLIYGPSGCGKSSLVKAGLLPRLSNQVIAVYVEATAEDTEKRLLNGLRKACPDLPSAVDLKDTLAALRRGSGLSSGRRVVIVLDQFEQWLHAKREEENTELVEALRQCDGAHVQCIVMVRDDFWVAATRFMRELEVRLVEGHNSALVDLFSLRHAEKVLTAFGQAFGSLSERSEEIADAERAFIKLAVQGLAEEGKVICVRLSLFAEMMKHKPWTPASLQEVGGAAGVGVAFLEETFSSATAPPQHRVHQKAARAVLKALLPETGTDIKGQMRSRDELLEASGYARLPREFEELLHILDSELRLITPTDPQGFDEDAVAGRAAPVSPLMAPESSAESISGLTPSARLTGITTQYYQLTHDYLVPSLREWLTRKQRETRRGRAELRLADRAALWSRKPESRHLPSLWEYLNIRWHTRKKDWSEPQRKMMTKAGRTHSLRWGSAAAVLVVATLMLQHFLAAQRRENDLRRAETLVQAVLNVAPDDVPRALQDLAPLREVAVPLVRQRFEAPELEPRQRLHAALALAAFGDVRHDYLAAQVMAQPKEAANMVAAMAEKPAPALEAIHRAFRKRETEKPEAANPGGATDHTTRRGKTRLAVVALNLGDPTLAQEMCRPLPDPIERTIFIDEFPTCYGNLTALAKSAETLDDPSLIAAVCLGVGRIPAEEIDVGEKQAWQAILSEWYPHKADAGAHAAAAWALRKWKADLPAIAPSKQPEGRAWHVNSVGMTMVKIPAGSFTRKEYIATANPAESNERDQEVVLSRSFLLSDREVSVGVFQKFIDDPDYPAEDKPQAWGGVFAEISPTPEHPANQVNWFDAVLFCNWLSRKEGLKPYYERTGEKPKKFDTNYDGKVDDRDREFDAWRPVADANGYRLPTEAEWEYACRAGSTTAFAFGDDESLLTHYAVYVQNSLRTEVCGSKLPNAWGLSDMQGNLWEWCYDWYGDYGRDGRVENPMGPEYTEQGSRVLRGGAFVYLPVNLRSAYRNLDRSGNRNHFLGFRPARTYP